MSDRFRCRARLTVDHGCRLLRRIGSKIFIADLLGLEKFPPAVSLSVTLGIIAAGIVWSLFRTRSGAPRTDAA